MRTFACGQTTNVRAHQHLIDPNSLFVLFLHLIWQVKWHCSFLKISLFSLLCIAAIDPFPFQFVSNYSHDEIVLLSHKRYRNNSQRSTYLSSEAINASMEILLFSEKKSFTPHLVTIGQRGEDKDWEKEREWMKWTDKQHKHSKMTDCCKFAVYIQYIYIHFYVYTINYEATFLSPTGVTS